MNTLPFTVTEKVKTQGSGSMGGIGNVTLQGVDFKTTQNILPIFPRKNARLRLLNIAILSTSISSLSNGATVILSEVNASIPVAATLSTNMSNATNNDVTLTAVTAGAGGNSITLTLANPATPSAVLGVVVTGNDIVVNLGTDAGTAQVETATVAEDTPGTLTAGNVTVTVTGVGITGSPLAVSVAAATNDSAATVAGKIRTVLAATAAITVLYTVGGSSALVSLTEIVPNGNDSTLNIAIADGTSSGIAAAASSANTTPGVAPAITTTGTLLLAALAASAPATALVTGANKSANNGSGLVAALSSTPLAGGVDWTAIEDLVASTDLADTDAVDTRQEIAPTVANDVIAAGNNFLFKVTGGSTATTDTKDVVITYEVLD